MKANWGTRRSMVFPIATIKRTTTKKLWLLITLQNSSNVFVSADLNSRATYEKKVRIHYM